MKRSAKRNTNTQSVKKQVRKASPKKQTRRASPKKNKTKKFGFVNPSDYEFERRLKKLNGHFTNPCGECKDEYNAYNNLKFTNMKFSKDRIEWMKEQCLDCADLNCSYIIKAKKLGMKVPESEMKNCLQSLNLGELVKKINQLINESKIYCIHNNYYPTTICNS